MFDPEFFDPLIKLFCKQESVLRKTGLNFFALHTRACVCARAAHMRMTRSPIFIFTKRIEILMWDNSGRVRNGSDFAADMGVTHV